ncbi:DUF7537 family lipoprotein [Halobaculum marinum]|uniref:Outer membrane lipoprotein-sorting protein n=1 Tax=Halobaculum marinum TaxID=3031996 RepID=A0ABD5WUN7_9EURY|nr:hypothetical protein [Halobaculum sp. DT55]
MRPPRTVVLVCVCLLLAGCGGVADTGGPNAQTVNPALDDTPTASPTPAEPTLPPGVTESDVDLRSLVAAHDDALDDRSVTVTLSRTRTATNGTVVLDTTARSYAADPEQFLVSTAEVTPYSLADGASFDRALWRNDTVSVRRSAGERAVTVVHDTDVPRQRAFDPTGAAEIRGVLGPYKLQYAGTVTQNGSRRHLLTETDAGRPSVPLRSNVTVRVLVTDDGVVEHATVRYRTTEFDEPRWVTVEFAVSNVSSTTVPRPEWVDRALANVSDP